MNLLVSACRCHESSKPAQQRRIGYNPTARSRQSSTRRLLKKEAINDDFSTEKVVVA